MSATKSRFNQLAQALKDGTAGSPTAESHPAEAATAPVSPHRPATALNTVTEGLRERVSRLEAELAAANTNNGELHLELSRARSLSSQAGADIEEFHFIDPASVIDPLPKDRLHGGFEGSKFGELLEDIRANGQNDAITVRRSALDQFEIAAGRRRLEVCRQLGRPVLARVRDLDDASMLRVQFSENERRSDISALERARWFAEVRERLSGHARDIAAQFGVDPSTFSLYLRLARFPDAILERLHEPQRLAVLPARRVMEAIEKDPDALQRILDALDAHQADSEAEGEGGDQIDVLLRAADGKPARSTSRSPVPERRHIVYQGRRIGTLTRNGGQWVFRFATSIPDRTVQVLVERLAAPVIEDAPAGAPIATQSKTKR